MDTTLDICDNATFEPPLNSMTVTISKYGVELKVDRLICLVYIKCGINLNDRLFHSGLQYLFYFDRYFAC